MQESAPTNSQAHTESPRVRGPDAGGLGGRREAEPEAFTAISNLIQLER